MDTSGHQRPEASGDVQNVGEVRDILRSSGRSESEGGAMQCSANEALGTINDEQQQHGMLLLL